MSIAVDSTISVRAESRTVSVTCTVVFVGNEATPDGVSEHFVDGLRSWVAEHGPAAADAIEREHEDVDSALRSAVEQALERLDPKRREEVARRYALDDLTSTEVTS